MRLARLIAVSALGCGFWLCGCAAGPSPQACATTFVINVSPTTGTANHVSTAPGNQVVFSDTGDSPPPGQPTAKECFLNNVIGPVIWTSSDTVNVQLTPSADNESVTATCMGATTVPVMITANQLAGGLSGSGTTTLTCI